MTGTGTNQLSALPWNGASGGVTGVSATGDVSLTGTIQADSAGFRAGQLFNGVLSGCTQLDGSVGGGKGEGIVPRLRRWLQLARQPRQWRWRRKTVKRRRAMAAVATAEPAVSRYVVRRRRPRCRWSGGQKLLYSAFDHAVFGGGGGGGDGNNNNAGPGGAGGGL